MTGFVPEAQFGIISNLVPCQPSPRTDTTPPSWESPTIPQIPASFRVGDASQLASMYSTYLLSHISVRGPLICRHTSSGPSSRPGVTLVLWNYLRKSVRVVHGKPEGSQRGTVSRKQSLATHKGYRVSDFKPVLQEAKPEIHPSSWVMRSLRAILAT